MTWQFSVYLLPLLAGMAISAALIVTAWRQRTTGGAPALSFMALMIAALVWCLVYTIELGLSDLNLKLSWAKIRYMSIVSIPVLWLIFTANFTRQDRWLTPQALVLLFAMPTLTTALMWTTEIHGLMWGFPLRLVQIDQISVVNNPLGKWFYVHTVYSYLMLLGGLGFLVRAHRRSPGTYRHHLFAFVIAVVAPWVGNFLTITGLSMVDFTPFAFTITGIAMGWGVLRLHMLSIVPVARDVVVEGISDSVLVLDAQNRIVDLNPAAERLFRSARHQLLGKLASEVLPILADPKILSQASLETSLGQGSDARDLELSFSRLYGRGSRLSGTVIIMHDVTQRLAAERRIQAQNEALIKANIERDEARREAEEATRLKSSFLATMSHELRTPLNAIIGYTEIQLAGMAGDLNKEQSDFQQRVLTNAEHLLNLINEVLDLAKIEAGRMDLQKKAVVVRDWAEEILTQMRGLLEGKDLRLESSLAANMPTTLIGDPGRLKQVVINLLANAIKFTEKGVVKLDIARDEGNTWRIEVTDTGRGIAPHLLETIFQEFRQVDGTSTREHGGSGLGLAIVRRLALLMGGTVRVKSQVGEGSTFSVFLPLVEESQPASTAPAAVPELSAR
jgi:signal transduction histidine kinase